MEFLQLVVHLLPSARAEYHLTSVQLYQTPTPAFTEGLPGKKKELSKPLPRTYESTSYRQSLSDLLHIMGCGPDLLGVFCDGDQSCHQRKAEMRSSTLETLEATNKRGSSRKKARDGGVGRWWGGGVRTADKQVETGVQSGAQENKRTMRRIVRQFVKWSGKPWGLVGRSRQQETKETEPKTFSGGHFPHNWPKTLLARLLISQTRDTRSPFPLFSFVLFLSCNLIQTFVHVGANFKGLEWLKILF